MYHVRHNPAEKNTFKALLMYCSKDSAHPFLKISLFPVERIQSIHLFINVSAAGCQAEFIDLYQVRPFLLSSERKWKRVDKIDIYTY